MPKETGEHLVHVKKNGQHVASSPIPVVISQSEIGDASRVRVSGQGLHEGHTFEPAEFIIDTRDAGRWWWPTSWGKSPGLGPPWLSGVPSTGYGGLSLSIEGPSKVDINTEDLEDGTCRVTYCPTEPGNYIINIKFADQHVPGECDTHTAPVTEPPSVPHTRACPWKCNLYDMRAVLSSCRQPLLCEGNRRGPGEREHHTSATGPFGGQCWQSLRPQPEDPW